jgi:hypothetical protein
VGVGFAEVEWQEEVWDCIGLVGVGFAEVEWQEEVWDCIGLVGVGFAEVEWQEEDWRCRVAGLPAVDMGHRLVAEMALSRPRSKRPPLCLSEQLDQYGQVVQQCILEGDHEGAFVLQEDRRAPLASPIQYPLCRYSHKTCDETLVDNYSI